MPLAWPNAVPTAALLKEPMIRCEPLWRIQLADHSPIEQELQRRPHRADDAERSRGTPSEHPRPVINLDDGAFVRQELRIRIVCTEHQQQLAMHHRIVDGLGADHADAAHPAGLVVRHDVLALD